jgi:hypothetical protein
LCGGQRAAFGGCQVQRDAQRYRIGHDVSYAEAVRQTGGTTLQTDGASMAGLVVRGPTDRTGLSTSPDMVSRPVQKSCAHKYAVTKDSLIVNTIYFIAFIGKLINNLDCVKQKYQV